MNSCDEIRVDSIYTRIYIVSSDDGAAEKYICTCLGARSCMHPCYGFEWKLDVLGRRQE